MKVLIVVDMQKDFISGPLGNEQTKAVVPHVIKRIEEAIENKEQVWYTFDTHNENYMETIEGKNLPIPHCIINTDGWNLVDELKNFPGECIDKPTFGSYDLPVEIARSNDNLFDDITDITLIGVCTDICVVSNAMILKSFFCSDKYPVNIHVDARCCAGTSPENHEKALDVMQSCQIIVEGR